MGGGQNAAIAAGRLAASPFRFRSKHVTRRMAAECVCVCVCVCVCMCVCVCVSAVAERMLFLLFFLCTPTEVAETKCLT